jgi:hypothetical protein
MDISESSIELRKNIMITETEINNLNNALNIISAQRYNITNINYNELKNIMTFGVGKKIRYIIVIIIIFFLINLILIYKNIIKKRYLLLFIICIIGIFCILLYRFIKLKSIDIYINNLKITNQKKLIQFDDNEKNISNKILELKMKITKLYEQLKYISKTL